MPRDDWFDLDIHAQRVLFGAARLDDVPREVESLGIDRILLVATGSAGAAGDHVAALLGTRVVGRVTEVVQHVPEASVRDALTAAADGAASGILTIGGGSATGLGKATAVRTGLPVVAVPTTYAGSEATSVFGVTGKHKQTGRDPRALPRMVIYDPVLTTGMPRRLTAASGLNALAHCVEALYAPLSNPVTTVLALEATRRLASALPVAVETPEDLGARGDALLGAYLAGCSMEQAGTALHHTLCHVIGGTYRVDHGEVHAVLLPYVAAYNLLSAAEPLGQLALALGGTDAPSAIRALAEHLGAPTSLCAIGLPGDALDDVAERALAAVGDRNPRRPDLPSLRRLLDDAYTGQPPGRY